jgi:hypothetical protein
MFQAHTSQTMMTGARQWGFMGGDFGEGGVLGRILIHAEAQRSLGDVPPITVIPKSRQILLEAIALPRDSDNKY